MTRHALVREPRVNPPAPAVRTGPRLWTTALAMLLCLGFGARALAAGTFEEGRAAYQAGDYKKAFEILKPLAEQGDPKAEVTLGIMYDYGHGVPKDEAKAIDWYKKAALQGIPVVQHDLGVKYFRGLGVKKNYKEAVKWWRMAAENGQAESQFNLGLMYSRGLGVKQDDKKAVKWFRKAADQGHPNAEYGLAVMYAFGHGVPLDYDKAMDWFTKAAEQNVPQAEYNLGILYEYGHGTMRNLKQAVHWYRKAAGQGLAQAKQKLADLGEPLTPPPAPAADAGAGATAAPASAAAANTKAGAPHEEGWVNAQNPHNYTLQLASLSDEAAAMSFLKQHKLGPDTASVKTIIDGKIRYAALYGVFPSYGEARKALEALPPPLQKAKPWIRKFSVLQTLMEQ